MTSPTDFTPAGPDGRFRGTGEVGDAPVGEPELLGPPQHVRVGQRRLDDVLNHRINRQHHVETIARSQILFAH